LIDLLCFLESSDFGYGIVEFKMGKETSDSKNINLSLDIAPKTASKLEVPNEVVAVFRNAVKIIFLKF
jgi:hypothetical protein